MTAFIFTLGVFIYFWFLGYATLSMFNPRLRLMQSILISPAMGIAVVLLPLFLINRMGLPVQVFGQFLLLGLLVISGVIVLIKKPIFPTRRLLPLMGLLIVALALAAWPMFLYQFDWTSVGNDDMANYCLGAQRFLNAGYFDEPNLTDLFAGRNYSLAYWFMHVAGKMRAGSELMLSVWWAATGLNAHQIFMPIIFALHLSLICATGALVAGKNFSKKAPLIAMSLLAISPLTTLGAIDQLIGQVGGLTLLCAASLMFCRDLTIRPFRRLISPSIAGAIIFSALFLWYPEALPFLGLGWILFLVIKIFQNRSGAAPIIIPSLLIGMLTLLFLGSSILNALEIMMGQARIHGSASDAIILFPYFLIPSGIPALFGLASLGARHEPFISIAIVLGCIICIWMLRQTIKGARISYPPALILTVMIVLSIVLIYKRYDFGLFKLSMYMQPFLIAVAVAAICTWSQWKGKQRITRSLFALVVVLGVYTQFLGVTSSTGEVMGSFNEIAHANSKKLPQKFHEFIQTLPEQKNHFYIADISNVVLAKIQSLYTQGKSIYFPGRNFYVLMNDYKKLPFYEDNQNAYMNDFKTKKSSQYKQGVLSVGDLDNRFSILQLPRDQKGSWIISNHQSIFNRSHVHSDKKEIDFELVDNPVNHLVFIHSKLGAHYYSPGKKKMAFTQLSADFLIPGEVYSALGRHALLMVVGVTPRSRMVLDLSATGMGQFKNQLPSPVIYGANKIAVSFVGRGSGRLISEPIKPKLVEGFEYLHIDMGRDGVNYLEVKDGLSGIYAKDTHADWRRLTANGRDISLISEQEYQAMKPPTEVRQFPEDLVNPNLEYSGVYENGWISEHSFFILEPATKSKFLLIQGTIPLFYHSTYYSRLKDLIKGGVAGVDHSTYYFKLKWLVKGGNVAFDNSNFQSNLRISLNGKMIKSRQIKPGSYEVKIPVQSLQGRQRIDLAFNNAMQLGDRITDGKIDFIGFVEK